MITVYRVAYGKDSTPEEDREYKMSHTSAVGTKKYWLEYAEKYGDGFVEFVEQPYGGA